MASLIRRIFVYDDGSISDKYIGYRCLHMAEGGLDNPSGMPVVRPSYNAPPILFTKEMQRLSYEMNSYNPYFTKDKWRKVYAFSTAFTNENGFDEPNDPRADFVNNVDLTSPLPKLMKAIVCGGMFIRGSVENKLLVCKPGVSGIDVSKPLPSIAEVFARNWYFAATTGGLGGVYNFPQGSGNPVYIPYFLSETVTYPIEWFDTWNNVELPNPLTFYKGV